MAQGLNQATLIGNLGHDPELKYTQSGTAVLRLGLATNESFKDKQGERRDRTEWHRIIIFGKRGEGLSKVLSKGSQIAVVGRIQTRQWEDKEGNKRSTTEIVALDVKLLGSGKGNGGSGKPADSFGSGQADEYEEAYGGFGDDTIPF